MDAVKKPGIMIRWSQKIYFGSQVKQRQPKNILRSKQSLGQEYKKGHSPVQQYSAVQVSDTTEA